MLLQDAPRILNASTRCLGGNLGEILVSVLAPLKRFPDINERKHVEISKLR